MTLIYGDPDFVAMIEADMDFCLRREAAAVKREIAEILRKQRMTEKTDAEFIAECEAHLLKMCRAGEGRSIEVVYLRKALERLKRATDPGHEFGYAVEKKPTNAERMRELEAGLLRTGFNAKDKDER